ncbi:hypothetical protein ACFSQ7_41560 [Paenibacillus rhizoplanae]
MGVEGRELFAMGGGNAEMLEVAPCLNDTEEWISFLAELVSGTAQGWHPAI